MSYQAALDKLKQEILKLEDPEKYLVNQLIEQYQKIDAIMFLLAAIRKAT